MSAAARTVSEQEVLSRNNPSYSAVLMEGSNLSTHLLNPFPAMASSLQRISCDYNSAFNVLIVINKIKMVTAGYGFDAGAL